MKNKRNKEYINEVGAIIQRNFCCIASYIRIDII